MSRQSPAPQIATLAIVTGAVILLAMPVGGATAATAQDERACELLSPQLAFETLGVEPDDYERGVYDEPTYWACTYAWEADGTTRQLTFAISKVDDQDPAAVFEASTGALLRDGNHQEIDDLGDRAVWVPGVPQLSVQSGDHVFHLSVDGAGGDGLDASRRLAVELLARMD